MSHIRLWQFRPPPAQEAAFKTAYGPDGDWAQLFRRDSGFLGTELWRGEEGSFLTVDHWQDSAAFERFQRDAVEAYRALDRQLEGIAGEEIFLGAFDAA